MGIDAEIYCRMKGGTAPGGEWGLPEECDSLMVEGDELEWAPMGATHRIDVPWRYYDDGYARGPWPNIAAVLLSLLGDEDVEAVWYGGDCDNPPPPCDAERVAEISRHWCEHANRPYYERHAP